MSLAILYFTLLALLFPGNKTQITLAGEEPVKIGLLIPDSSQVRIIQAAEQAIEVANANGGLNGRPFKLVVRSTEGPWGAGSKESVSLVYDEDVRAIVGSLDGQGRPPRRGQGRDPRDLRQRAPDRTALPREGSQSRRRLRDRR